MGINPYLRGAVERELRQPWRIEPWRLEGEAEAAHERAVVLYPFADSELLTKGHGLTCVGLEGIGCGVAGLLPRLLLIRSTSSDEAWNLRVLHEFAHYLTREHFTIYSHADVWALTLMLACPRSAFRHIAHADHVPSWALDLRRLVARRVSSHAA